jgi:hypothetical protein
MATGKKNRVDTLTLKPSQVKSAIKHAVLAKRPVFLWGPPGIGKSSIIKQIASELGMDFEDVRLSQMAPDDIKGIPFPMTGADGVQSVHWIPPHFFPRNKDARTLILLDEMNAAVPTIQAAAYQLVLDRRIGEHILPENCMVMAAGNRETDKGATYRMATPLMNRFVHVEMGTDFEEWQTHALTEMYHRDVVGYVTFQKGELFEFEPSSASRGFPTPRTWQFVSDLLSVDARSSAIGEQELLGLIAGAVGEGIAVKFMEFRRTTSQLPDPTKILKGEIKEVKLKDVSVMYALTTSLCYELKSAYDDANKSKNTAKLKDWHQMVNNFLTFLMHNLQPEMVILGARTVMATYDLPLEPREMPIWLEFTKQYKDLILAA